MRPTLVVYNVCCCLRCCCLQCCCCRCRHSDMMMVKAVFKRMFSEPQMKVSTPSHLTSHITLTPSTLPAPDLLHLPGHAESVHRGTQRVPGRLAVPHVAAPTAPTRLRPPGSHALQAAAGAGADQVTSLFHSLTHTLTHSLLLSHTHTH